VPPDYAESLICEMDSGCGYGGDIRHSPELGIVPERVKEEVHAVRPLGALVVLLGHALSAVQARAFCDALDGLTTISISLSGRPFVLPKTRSCGLPASALSSCADVPSAPRAGALQRKAPLKGN
jgi:hypothetical protein